MNILPILAKSKADSVLKEALAYIQNIECAEDKLNSIHAAVLWSLFNSDFNHIGSISHYMKEFLDSNPTFDFTISLDEIDRSLFIGKKYPTDKSVLIQERIAIQLAKYDYLFQGITVVPLVYVVSLSKHPVDLKEIPTNIYHRLYCMKLSYLKNPHTPLDDHIRGILRNLIQEMDSLLIHHHDIEVLHRIYNAVYLVLLVFMSSQLASKLADPNFVELTKKIVDSIELPRYESDI